MKRLQRERHEQDAPYVEVEIDEHMRNRTHPPSSLRAIAEAIKPLAPLITAWGGFFLFLLLLSMIFFYSEDRAAFLAFMPTIFKTVMTAMGSLLIIALIAVALTWVGVPLVKEMLLPTMREWANVKRVLAEAESMREVPAYTHHQMAFRKEKGGSLEVQSVANEHILRFISSKMAEMAQQQQGLLPSPQIKQPSMQYVLSQLEPGALAVCPGVRADTGEPVILSLEDAVHFKVIGSSGFGKSCLAAALIEQATMLNTPDRLQIALLDLEHKTSRLFEDSPNVALFRDGRRSLPLVATSADEVATYLGYLKKELDRRARLSETDLDREPLLLMYVEEMLSLQHEVDEKLLSRMLVDLSVLAVRARKYRMLLLACAQTDYSTPALKTAQKQFRTRIAFAIDRPAAQAAGFQALELIKQNFATSQKGDGQFVLESPGIASLMLASVYDVKQKLLAKERSSTSLPPLFQAQPLRIVEDRPEEAWEEGGRGFGEADELSVRAVLRDIGKRLRSGESRADILKSYDAASGRANQEIGAVIDELARSEEEGA